MHKTMVTCFIRKGSFVCGATLLVLIVYSSIDFSTVKPDVPDRYLTVPFYKGRLGNQLYHLISGLCMAKQLNRKFYIRYDLNETDLRDHQLEQVHLIFPNFHHSYQLLAPWTGFEESVANAISSFDFVDPLQFSNETAQYLKLNVRYAQNWNYFRHCAAETKKFLTFADSVVQFGEEVKRTKKLYVNPVYTCAHIRRTDFIKYHAQSTLPGTVALLEHVISLQKSLKVALFGDDISFMRQVVNHLENEKKIEEGASYVSTYSQGIDLYIASEICGSFVITSPASSFGFWMAFLTKNQNNVYYYFPDETLWITNFNKSKFPPSWTALKVSSTLVLPSE